MKITKITIEDLGPYVGVNTFNFTVGDSEKNTVLIGGKNGAGKTTLFNAIKIGLYGCIAYGYEANNSAYIGKISEIINTDARLAKKGKAGVTISILMEDGKNDYQYTFERSWGLNTKALKENVIVTRNNEVLNETDKSDFQSYLLQLIPPDMFKFYFFDGESIGKFVFEGVKNTDFKKAFLKLCGLDTMEIIYDNFQRVSNSKKKDSSGTYENYQESLQQKREIDDNLENAYNLKENIAQKLVETEEDLAKCDAAFIQRGGITKEEYQSMQTQINKEETKRDVQRRWLKETANDVLPFVIIKPQLEALREQIVLEEKMQNAAALLDCLNNAEVRTKLCNAFEDEKIDSPFIMADKVIAVLESSVQNVEGQQILNLSKNEQMEVLAKISAVMAFDTESVKASSKEIDDSLERVKQIRQKLDKSDESGSESYFEKRNNLLTHKADLLKEQLSVERDIEALKNEKVAADSNAKKCQQKYEDYLKTKSVSDVTAKALLAFRDLQRRLYKKYISDVEKNFSECFGKLINKSDLIDGIKIDDELQVYPYKYQTFKRSEIIQMLTQSGENYMIDQLGTTAYDAFMEDTSYGEEISLPVQVKKKLSAGETQIFIMALYQALSSLNKVSVPYIIDTPFARIDAGHRQNILKNFFMSLKGQMLILSTDEEIVGCYKQTIEDSLSDTYLIQHEDGNGTKIYADTYFQEATE